MKKTIILSSLLISLSVFAATEDSDISAINKIGYGISKTSYDQIKKTGYEKWVKTQLDDSFNKDCTPKKQFNCNIQMSFNDNLNRIKHIESLKTDKEKIDYIYGNKGLVQKNLKKRIDYAIQSENELRERMVWFWFNHFNIGVYHNFLSAIFVEDFENKIRNLALDDFPSLLKMVSSHPTMLFYLDNDKNSKVYLNENYAREFLELHTIGVSGGYTQKDIIELSKILSGRGVAMYDGYFPTYVNAGDFKRGIPNIKDLPKGSVIKDFVIFNSENHDYSDKKLLGYTIRGTGYDEVDEFINLLTKRKETGVFISKKLAIYFMGDEPSKELIENMSQTFVSNNGNIRKTLETLFFSNEFKTKLTKKEKVKDTYDYVVSTSRFIFDKKTNDTMLTNLASNLTHIEGDPYFKKTPDGFSIYGYDWISSSRMQEYMFLTKMMLLNNDFSGNLLNQVNLEFISERINKKDVSKKDVFDYLTSDAWFYK